jgi:hypothetical protein
VSSRKRYKDDGERRERLLEKHKRYNASRKGQDRDKRYEDKHPERQGRWEKARNAMRPGGAP